MSVIYLIRHGRTEANEKHLYCGSTDLPLSEAGRSELEGLRAAYTVPPGCRFVTSGMRRTAETLEILFGAVPCDEEPDLREVDFGAFEMRSYEELRSDPAYQVWLEGDNMVN
ncbi:MAG: histidine phosphatase family protein, partial [Oscillospiraceae bacterium]|nr:histidine phosphatase family protein [Oscillospiraceae bacterium]